MTDTLRRPSPARTPLRRPPAARTRRPDPLLAGAPAALWAAAAGLVAVAFPVLVVWAADSRTGAGAVEALRAVAQVWLVAHGAALDLPSGQLGLAPLGLLVLPLALLLRAGRHAAQTRPVTGLGDAARLVGGVAGPYALLTALVAGAARGDVVQPVAWQALVGGLLVGAVGAGAGVLRASRLAGRLGAAVPARARRLGLAVAAVLAALLGGGALLGSVALALHVGTAAELAAGTGAGLVGGLALALLCLALLPNAAVWGACWLAGPGFAVGAGTAVTPLSTTLGAVPAFPLLAALPAGAPPRWAGLLVLAVPVLAGVLAGRVLERRAGGVLDTALVGPAAGVSLALLAWLAGGPLGGGRMSDVGPSPWRVGLALTVAVAAGAGSWALLRRRWPRSR